MSVLVAICTGRVEAKGAWQCGYIVPEHVAICTGRVEAKITALQTGQIVSVAICTGRVEAKGL